MSATIQTKRTESVFDQIKTLEDRIMRRAFEIFDGNGHEFGKDLDNWLEAERELVWKPAIELEEKDNAFAIQIAVPGVDPKDLNIEVTPDTILVKADSKHEHAEDKGKVHVCEFTCGSLFRSIVLPKEIDPDKVKAEFKNGMLSLTAEFAKESQPKKIQVAAS